MGRLQVPHFLYLLSNQKKASISIWRTERKREKKSLKAEDHPFSLPLTVAKTSDLRFLCSFMLERSGE
ncbi:hypothetical protein A0U92_12100 [Acetobacter aceti]|uniref:Uncharacterized protein n=1 Tax=Acetobacter aceti TaxID=435 RepID=A0A1U9KI19_ACEAC|nr:hypothetical protein A0U92_12100 [Acetobacter aceti]